MKNLVVQMTYRNMQLIIRMALLIGAVAGGIVVSLAWLLYTLL